MGKSDTNHNLKGTTMHHTHEAAQSAVSYGAAGVSSVAVVSLETAAGVAEQVTLILACAVVAVRLVYDVTRYVRLLTNKNKEK